MDQITVAFAMRCDQNGWSYEQGIRAAEQLGEELMQAAEDRYTDERVAKEGSTA